MDTNALSLAVVALTPTMRPEQLLEVRQRVEWLKKTAAELLSQVDAAMQAHIEATGRDIIDGDIRWYVGPKNTVKCKDVKGAVQWFYANNLDALEECLSANAFKHGACKEPMGDAWGQFFTVDDSNTLKDGKATKKLQQMNTKFLR